MEKFNFLRAKAAVCVALAFGGITGCNKNTQNLKIGDTGVAKDTVSLVINPLDSLTERRYCPINKGEGVVKGRDSYVSYDNGATSADVTFIDGNGDCSGWSYNGDYIKDFDWNK
jgi:uncharacterized protein (UPF0297 family)